MSASTPAGAPEKAESPPQEQAEHEPEIDYDTIAATPEFQALHRSRTRYGIGGTLFATAVLLVTFGLYGFAPDAMGKAVVGSLTWALLLGLVLIGIGFVMTWAYTRKSREWDELTLKVIEQAQQRIDEPTGRFAR